MKPRRTRRNPASRTRTTPIKTTFMELIQELAKLTKDDNLVVATVRHIFSRHKVITTRTLMPVKLVPALKPLRVRGSEQHSCWT